MSDNIKHECGIAFIRLLKPLAYYKEKYGTPFYGLNKLQLLMQKQRNRGQDGSGIATIKFTPPTGKRYLDRERAMGTNNLTELFNNVYSNFNDLTPEQKNDTVWLKDHMPFMGEVMMGHLRYATHGKNDIRAVHPQIRQSNWITRTLVLAGNFNLTNVDMLFHQLVEIGQYPIEKSDTVTILEKIGHFLDEEVQKVFNLYKPNGYTKEELNELIFHKLSVSRVLQRASRKFDGGWALVGIIGHGDAFVYRDPWGIRPAYYYQDDEIVVAASERPAIQTALDVSFKDILEIPAGSALIVKRDGRIGIRSCLDPAPKLSACSFERIYFSRGNDRDIYLERKALGKYLAKPVLEAIDFDYKNTVFSYIPNTAETAFGGMVDELEFQLSRMKREKINSFEAGKVSNEALKEILAYRPRVEKIVVKDAKMRTFIADDHSRGDLVAHVYDVTYGIVRNYQDSLVLLDDSIVRGTTLRDSIIRIVARLKPKQIVVVSSAPQIRYPDCYGIDMSKMQEFIAFQAMVSLLKDKGQENQLEQVYNRCKASMKLPLDQRENEVKVLYDQFTAQQISDKIAEMLRPKDLKVELTIIYQSIEDLHRACPDHLGDWYFTGNYPTPGGNSIANRAFMNYMEKKNVRAY